MLDTIEQRYKRQLDTSMRILNLFNTDSGSKDLVENVIREIKECLNCDATAIRIKENDDFPYASVFGFDEAFIKSENNIKDPDSSICGGDGSALCSHQCLCGLVLDGKAEETTLVTEYGSIVTNNINALSPIDLDGHLLRNYCGKVGYHSVLLVPLYNHKKEVIGLLQCNDTREKWFSEDDVLLEHRKPRAMHVVRDRSILR